MKCSQASTTLHLPPPMSPESPLFRNGLPFIRIPYPATSVPRDRVVLQAVSVALAGTRQNPITRFLLLLPSIAVFWFFLSLCRLPVRPDYSIYSHSLQQTSIHLSSASSCRPSPRDPVLWSCPPLNRPPLAVPFERIGGSTAGGGLITCAEVWDWSC